MTVWVKSYAEFREGSKNMCFRFPNLTVMDRFYSITYYGSLHFSKGWMKFLLALGISDLDFYHAACGSNSSYGLRSDAAEFYRDVLWYCLVHKREEAFRHISSRLLLSASLGQDKLPFFLEYAARGDGFDWWKKWHDTIKKEKLYASER